MATTTITATCACKSFSLEVTYPNSSLPLDRALCLCTTCRRLSGTCGISYVGIPPTLTIPPTLLKKLSTYQTSDRLERYFCSTCGAHVLVKILDESGRFHLATAMWDKTEGLINWTGCKWVEDTLDGGVSVWFKEIEDSNGTKRKLKRWLLRDRDGAQVPDGTLMELPVKDSKAATNPNEKLHAQCHCGGVKFYITRPNDESKKAHSPFPELTIRYADEPRDNPISEPWFLCANNTKYMAGTCTCTSCRHSSGFGEIITWAFVPKCNIFQEDGKPLDYTMGTLKAYNSSESVQREFCGVCGASVFWHSDARPEVVDVGIGLFDPAEGARVERWLEWWTEGVSYGHMAVSTSLVKSLENGLREWGKAKGHAREE